MAPNMPQPRSFFLNESHELTRGEKEGGGRLPKLAPIDWASKGMKIGNTLRASVQAIAQLRDPAGANHCYLLARPSPAVRKLSENRTLAPNGFLDELTTFAGKDSRVFTRLGMNMLNVTDDGAAVVHVAPQQAQQLYATASSLENFGPRDQARWVTLDSFEVIPSDLRLDHDWFAKIHTKDTIRASADVPRANTQDHHRHRVRADSIVFSDTFSSARPARLAVL
jgi:hypothetical protein